MGSARSPRHEANRRQLAADIIETMMRKVAEIPTIDLDDDAELAQNFLIEYLEAKFEDDGIWSDLILHANVALHKDRDSTRSPSKETRQMVLDMLAAGMLDASDFEGDPFEGLTPIQDEQRAREEAF